MLSELQLQRLFALCDSVKKLSESRQQEKQQVCKQFLKDNGLSIGEDPCLRLYKIKSSYKMKTITNLLQYKQDYCNLYKSGWVTDKDIIHYLGIDKLKKG